MLLRSHGTKAELKHTREQERCWNAVYKRRRKCSSDTTGRSAMLQGKRHEEMKSVAVKKRKKDAYENKSLKDDVAKSEDDDDDPVDGQVHCGGSNGGDAIRNTELH